MMNQRYDVVIVGAGMVGSALACILGGSSLRVALIESRMLQMDWPAQGDDVNGFDTRVSALTIASQRLLDALGAWPQIHGQRVSPYRRMHVWDAEGTASISFDASDVNRLALGHIVENRLVATALLRQVEACANVDVIAPATLDTLEPTASGYRVILAGGRVLDARLVVAADGANSRIRQLADLPMREWDYGHHAIVATVRCEREHRQTAWQRFLPEGPLAFLPLATAAGDAHYCSIVWSAIPAYAENLMVLDEDVFCQQLGAAFEYRLGRIQACGPRFSFLLRQRHAINYARSGLALVGDAAHTIHPLAGQGVNLGLMDAKALGEELLRAARRELNPGSEAVLRRYQRRRKTDNLAMMAGMDGFKRLFGQTRLPLRWARNAGMRWLDGATPLKRQIMRWAMGL